MTNKTGYPTEEYDDPRNIRVLDWQSAGTTPHRPLVRIDYGPDICWFAITPENARLLMEKLQAYFGGGQRETLRDQTEIPKKSEDKTKEVLLNLIDFLSSHEPYHPEANKKAALHELRMKLKGE